MAVFIILFLRSDQEIIGLTLETLVSIMSIETSVENGDKEQLKIETDLAIQFTEIFLKKQDNITVLLGLLEVGRIDSCFIGKICYVILSAYSRELCHTSKACFHFILSLVVVLQLIRADLCCSLFVQTIVWRSSSRSI